MNNSQKIDISSKTILKFFAFILGLVFLYYIRNVVALIFVVVIIVAGLSPFVNNMVKSKVPRILSVTIIYLLILTFIALVIYSIIPPLTNQINLISDNLSFYTNKLNAFTDNIAAFQFQSQSFLDILSQYLGKVSGGVVNSVSSVFGSAASAITVMVLTFYILVEQNSVENIILAFMPRAHREKAIHIYDRINTKLGRWLRGQIILALVIGLVSYLVLTILGIKYALALAVLAGVLEIVPILGPVIAGLAAIVIAYFTGASWWTVLMIAVSYIIVQQLENHFLVPKIMGKAVGLSPVIIIVALLIGSELGGIIGAILAIPIAAGVSVVAQEWSRENKIEI